MNNSYDIIEMLREAARAAESTSDFAFVRSGHRLDVRLRITTEGVEVHGEDVASTGDTGTALVKSHTVPFAELKAANVNLLVLSIERVASSLRAAR